MTDEQATVPTEEVAPEPEAEVTAEEVETEDEGVEAADTDTEASEEGADDAEGGEGEETTEEDLVEFDFGGNKMSVPKGAIPDDLAQEIDRFTKGVWSDYTKKSQDVTERTKALTAQEEAVGKLAALNGETLTTYSRGLQLREEIGRLQQVDVNALWQSNPDQARRVSDTIASKQAEFQSIVNQVAQAEHQITQTQQAEIARRAREGAEVLERSIKTFKQDLPDVIEYAHKTLGISKEEAESGWALNPAVTIAVHKAMQFDRMQAKAQAKAVPKPTAPAKPVVAASKGKGGKGRVDPDKLSPDEWLKWRNAQLQKSA